MDLVVVFLNFLQPIAIGVAVVFALLGLVFVKMPRRSMIAGIRRTMD
jgi:hypothetical protein